ncbi:MAG: hypothetical protein KDD36_13490 [Flavobacteriales bacterium]|nr:hypothetical protein [Flavobacteriales bacterium]
MRTSPNIMVKTEKMIIEFLEDDLVHIKVLEGMEVTVDDIQKMEEVVEEQGGGRPYRNLIVAENYVTTTFKTVRYMGTEEANRLTIADAFVINSLPQRIMANFYLNVVKPLKPTKFFKTEEEAFSWLKQFELQK